MHQPLFNDCIPVSEQEVQDWLNTVPNLSAAKHRREAYRKAYNVEDKIREQKRRESLAQTCFTRK